MSRGDGVLFAIKNTILTKSIPSPSNLELLAIESNHVIVVTYLPPNLTKPLLASRSGLFNQPGFEAKPSPI